MDADELRHKARQRLKADGYQMDDSYQCRVHVQSSGAGCTVDFMKGFGHPVYFVEFDRGGRIRRVRTGVAVEGRGEKL